MRQLDDKRDDMITPVPPHVLERSPWSHQIVVQSLLRHLVDGCIDVIPGPPYPSPEQNCRQELPFCSSTVVWPTRISSHCSISTRSMQTLACGSSLLSISPPFPPCSDLRGVGGLPTLLALLSDADAGVRSRAAAVLGACAQNNAPTQQVVAAALMPTYELTCQWWRWQLR